MNQQERPEERWNPAQNVKYASIPSPCSVVMLTSSSLSLSLSLSLLSSCTAARTILLSVISLLNEPNISSPANVDASVSYRNWREGKADDYEKTVKQQVERSKVQADKDGVVVPMTTDEYVVRHQVSQQSTNSDLWMDDNDDDDFVCPHEKEKEGRKEGGRGCVSALKKKKSAGKVLVSFARGQVEATVCSTSSLALYIFSGSPPFPPTFLIHSISFLF
mgnify:CR=1 FL=1